MNGGCFVLYMKTLVIGGVAPTDGHANGRPLDHLWSRCLGQIQVPSVSVIVCGELKTVLLNSIVLPACFCVGIGLCNRPAQRARCTAVGGRIDRVDRRAENHPLFQALERRNPAMIA